MDEQKHNVKFLNGKGVIIEVDGVTYKPGKKKYCMKDGVKHIQHTEFEPVDLNERDKLLKELGKKLRDKVPPERVIEEMFKSHNMKDLQRLSKKLDTGEIKAKTTNGCLGITFKNIKKNKKQYEQIYG